MKAKTRDDVEEMSQSPKLFVRFKSDLCPYCVESQPEWDELERQLETITLAPGCMVGEIDSKLSQLFQGVRSDGETFEVGGIPAYELFNDGKQVKMESPKRDAASLLALLKKHGFIAKKNGAKRPKRKSKRRKSKKRKSRRGTRK